MNIYEKIQAVANEVKSIEKDMQVGSGTYSYKAVSDLSVTKAVKEAEAKYKLVSIPIRQEMVDHQVVKTVYKDMEKVTYSFLIKMTVLIVNTENPEEKLEVETFGHGLDTADKGTGKASTYARKYALLNAYKIATGEDPDNEESPKENSSPKTISEKRAAVENYYNQHMDALNNLLKYYSVGEIGDLTEKQIETIYKTGHERRYL